MPDQNDTQGGGGSPGPSRADELELWDRVLKRWNEHTARQIRNVGITVSVVIAIAGFFGIRSIDRMVEESVRTGVSEAVAKESRNLQTNIDRLSDQAGNSMATMIVKLAAFQQQSDEASELIVKMKKDSITFGRLNTELNERIANMKRATARFDDLQTKLIARLDKADAVVSGFAGLERELQTRLDGFRAQLASAERELKKSREDVRVVKADVVRANRLASSVALAAAPAQKSEVFAKIVPLEPAEVRALRVRQVPDKLDKYTRSKRPLYLLTFSIGVDKQATTRDPEDLLDAIETVTYRFDKRWFKRAEIERTNREDNFKLAMRVWGSTMVGVRAKLAGRARPVCWSGMMSLDRPVVLKPLSVCPPL